MTRPNAPVALTPALPAPSPRARGLARLARLVRARSTRGMTLVEIMIVVVIMALMATAVGVAVIPRLQRARVTQTRTDAGWLDGGTYPCDTVTPLLCVEQ